MYLSRIKIQNFRNFSLLDVPLAGNVVVVGENRVGKSNLLQALRLILDPTVPDSARQLSISDFWDGLETLGEEDKIIVSIEIKDFEDDLDVLAWCCQLNDIQPAQAIFGFIPLQLGHDLGARHRLPFTKCL
jgi:putative ATP-dependent endonuclease of OLD family